MGRLDPDAILRELPARLWQEWQAFYGIDPWGEERADLRAGIIASAAISPYCKKGQTPQPIDFMPFARRGKPRQQCEADMRANWKAAVTAFNRVAGKKKKPNG